MADDCAGSRSTASSVTSIFSFQASDTRSNCCCTASPEGRRSGRWGSPRRRFPSVSFRPLHCCLTCTSSITGWLMDNPIRTDCTRRLPVSLIAAAAPSSAQDSHRVPKTIARPNTRPAIDTETSRVPSLWLRPIDVRQSGCLRRVSMSPRVEATPDPVESFMASGSGRAWLRAARKQQGGPGDNR